MPPPFSQIKGKSIFISSKNSFISMYVLLELNTIKLSSLNNFFTNLTLLP